MWARGDDSWLAACPRHAKRLGGGWVDPDKLRPFNPSPPPTSPYSATPRLDAHMQERPIQLTSMYPYIPPHSWDVFKLADYL